MHSFFHIIHLMRDRTLSRRQPVPANAILAALRGSRTIASANFPGRKLLPLLACVAIPLNGMAQEAQTSAQALHAQGQYEAAATQGLATLLSEPWNHALRFIVADSLQRTGRINEAITQYQAMEGTALASSAAERLETLRPARQAAAPRAGVVAETGLQYQFVEPGMRASTSTPAVTPITRSRDRRLPSNTPAQAASARSPAVQELYDLSAAENYQAVGTRGLALLAREKQDDEVRLMIANSLAWTGRLPEAVTQYQALLKGTYAKQASVGLGNVYRWQGRDEQSLPLYRAVLASDASNADALEGLQLAGRELSPRTTFTVGGSRDSSDMERRAAGIAHRWRDRSGKNVFEIETSGVNDEIGASRANQRDLTLRYQAKGISLQPSIELSAQNKPERTAFGNLRVQLGDTRSFAEIGRVNWGRMASNARALESNLTAVHAGVQGFQSFTYGSLSERLDYYDISDGNKILTSAFQFTPSWRPLGSHFKPFVGMETRDPRFNSPNYWSPAEGFGTAYAGILGEWGAADWSFFASGLRGKRLYGEAGTSWSLSAGGKRWIGDDMAVGLNLWSMASVRDRAAYKSKSMTMSVEKLWK